MALNIDQRIDFFSVLAAPGRSADIPEPADVYGWLCGSWDLAVLRYRGIDVGEVPSLWIPASMSAQVIPGFNGQLERRMRWMQILARLKPDVTMERAQAGLQPWFKAMLDDAGPRLRNL